MNRNCISSLRKYILICREDYGENINGIDRDFLGAFDFREGRRRGGSLR